MQKLNLTTLCILSTALVAVVSGLLVWQSTAQGPDATPDQGFGPSGQTHESAPTVPDAIPDQGFGPSEQTHESAPMLPWLAALCAAAALAALVFAVLLAHRLRWLRSRAHAAVVVIREGAIREGNETPGVDWQGVDWPEINWQEIDLRGADEASALAGAFNALAAELTARQNRWQAHSRELEQTLAERSTALENANETLRLDEERRREFFADVSHELRTPLTVIRGEAEVTLRLGRNGAAAYPAALHRIIELTSQMSRLVEDLLFLAKADMTRNRYDFGPIDVQYILEALAGDAANMSRESRIEVQVKPCALPQPVNGDKLRLKQLFRILLENAIRYSPHGSTVEVSAERSGDHVVFAVRDQGIGMTEEELKQIRNRFFRSDRARSLVPNGSGLGLAVAESIVKSHNGKLHIKSYPDEGTEVTVTLRLGEHRASTEGECP